jgi:hypothetical protein
MQIDLGVVDLPYDSGGGGGGGGGGGDEHWGDLPSSSAFPAGGWSTGPDASQALDGVSFEMPGARVAAGSSAAGAVAGTVTQVTRRFEVDTMGNVRMVSESSEGASFNVRNGADATPSEHWGDMSSTEFNLPVDSSSTESGATYNVESEDAGRNVHLSGVWIQKGGSNEEKPGGLAAKFRQQKIDLRVDSMGNAHALVKGATQDWSEIRYPLGAVPTDALNDPVDTNNVQSSTVNVSLRGSGAITGRIVHLGSSWFKQDSQTGVVTFRQQKVDLHVDSFGAISRLVAGASSTVNIPTVGNSTFNGTVYECVDFDVSIPTSIQIGDRHFASSLHVKALFRALAVVKGVIVSRSSQPSSLDIDTTFPLVW